MVAPPLDMILVLVLVVLEVVVVPAVTTNTSNATSSGPSAPGRSGVAPFASIAGVQSLLVSPGLSRPGRPTRGRQKSVTSSNCCTPTVLMPHQGTAIGRMRLHLGQRYSIR